MRKYYKLIGDCTECPNFSEEFDWDDGNCPDIMQLQFFCGDRKICDAVKNNKGQWDNTYCEIPDWCPLPKVNET